MSQDYKLARTCDHKIFWEIAELDTEDMKSLLVASPIISSNIQVRATGNLLSPSEYMLVDNPSVSYAPRKIYFRQRRKAVDDVYEVTYLTERTSCTKCVGLKVLDDIQYDNSGQIIMATDEYLLIQNVEKYVITNLGSNSFHNWVGTNLLQLTGQVVSDPDYLKTKITQEVSATLNKFKSMQSQQMGTQRPMSDGEILQLVESVNAQQDVSDPTIFRVDVSVRSRSNSPSIAATRSSSCPIFSPMSRP